MSSTSAKTVLWRQSDTVLRECPPPALKHASRRRRHWRMAGAMTKWSRNFSCCFSSSRSVMRVLYAFSYRCNQLNSNLANFWSHSWGGINSGVSFSHNSIVARARWAFDQLSQGSAETLFSRCVRGKRLHDFAANLFRKLYAEFYQKSASFV